MSDTRYMISEMAKILQLEPHVLRYWEEELKLSVKRNEMGHRYYTDKDIQTFLKVKELKKSGMQLRAIRKALDEEGNTEEITVSREERVVPFVRPDNLSSGEVEKENPEHLGMERTMERQRTQRKISKEDRFYQIMERLIGELNKEEGKENRYRKLDETIRKRQQSRKMVAAALENGKQKKKKMMKYK